jgi:hypothetical protein
MEGGVGGLRWLIASGICRLDQPPLCVFGGFRKRAKRNGNLGEGAPPRKPPRFRRSPLSFDIVYSYCFVVEVPR